MKKRDALLHYVVDDNPLQVEAIRGTTAKMEAVDLIECRSAEEVQELDRAPDLVLVNICSSLTQCPNYVLLTLRERIPDVLIVCYAPRHLVCGFVRKVDDRMLVLANEDLIPALRNFAATQHFKGFRDRALKKTDVAVSDLEKALCCLTVRELEIFCLLGKCQGSPEIAERLGLQKNTVQTHVKNIRMKLGFSGMMQLRLAAGRMTQTASCHVFSREDDHICPHSNESIGLCPRYAQVE